MKPELITSSIIEYLKCSDDASGGELDPDAQLSQLGVDSFGLIEILLFLEAKYKVLLPARVLTYENTSSLNRLAKAYSEYYEAQSQVNKS